MLFNSPQFVLTFLLLICCWYIEPKETRRWCLLLFDYCYIYLLGGIASVITLIFVTVITYCFGITISKKKSRRVNAFSLAILVLILVLCRYEVALASHVTFLNPIAVIGVSYYIFSAISYIVDVYRGDDTADDNILNVAIWLSLFTKIIAGPIERHKGFSEQINNLKTLKFDIEQIKHGLLICSLGYFYKIVIADRLGIFVDQVYSRVGESYGFTLLITMILYSLQIYYDFAGYSLIAQGASYALGISLVRNFDHPYFSESIGEFWRKWHISLSGWLRDYIYIPLGGNRKGKLRKKINIMITFLVSGAWHGVGLNFIFWGALHGLYQIIEQMIGQKIKAPKYVRIAVTFFCVSIAWVLFRARSLHEALLFFRHMLSWNPHILVDGTLLGRGLDLSDWIVLIVAVVISVLVGVAQSKQISLYGLLQNRGIVIRWAVYYVIIFVLLIFGKYGDAYNPNNFIYINF